MAEYIAIPLPQQGTAQNTVKQYLRTKSNLTHFDAIAIRTHPHKKNVYGTVNPQLLNEHIVFKNIEPECGCFAPAYYIDNGGNQHAIDISTSLRAKARKLLAFVIDIGSIVGIALKYSLLGVGSFTAFPTLLFVFLGFHFLISFFIQRKTYGIGELVVNNLFNFFLFVLGAVALTAGVMSGGLPLIIAGAALLVLVLIETLDNTPVFTRYQNAASESDLNSIENEYTYNIETELVPINDSRYILTEAAISGDSSHASATPTAAPAPSFVPVVTNTAHLGFTLAGSGAVGAAQPNTSASGAVTVPSESSHLLKPGSVRG